MVLEKLGFEPDFVGCSSLTRAAQTAYFTFPDQEIHVLPYLCETRWLKSLSSKSNTALPPKVKLAAYLSKGQSSSEEMQAPATLCEELLYSIGQGVGNFNFETWWWDQSKPDAYKDSNFQQFLKVILPKIIASLMYCKKAGKTCKIPIAKNPDINEQLQSNVRNAPKPLKIAIIGHSSFMKEQIGCMDSKSDKPMNNDIYSTFLTGLHYTDNNGIKIYGVEKGLSKCKLCTFTSNGVGLVKSLATEITERKNQIENDLLRSQPSLNIEQSLLPSLKDLIVITSDAYKCSDLFEKDITILQNLIQKCKGIYKRTEFDFNISRDEALSIIGKPLSSNSTHIKDGKFLWNSTKSEANIGEKYPLPETEKSLKDIINPKYLVFNILMNLARGISLLPVQQHGKKIDLWKLLLEDNNKTFDFLKLCSFQPDNVYRWLFFIKYKESKNPQFRRTSEEPLPIPSLGGVHRDANYMITALRKSQQGGRDPSDTVSAPPVSSESLVPPFSLPTPNIIPTSTPQPPLQPPPVASVFDIEHEMKNVRLIDYPVSTPKKWVYYQPTFDELSQISEKELFCHCNPEIPTAEQRGNLQSQQDSGKTIQNTTSCLNSDLRNISEIPRTSSEEFGENRIVYAAARHGSNDFDLDPCPKYDTQKLNDYIQFKKHGIPLSKETRERINTSSRMITGINAENLIYDSITLGSGGKYAGIENLAASIIMQCDCEGPPPTPLQTIQIRYGVGIKSVYDQDIPTRGVIGGSNRISSSVRSASVSQSGGGENFKYIVNPNTNEKHLIDSEEGQKLFEIYQKLKK